MHMPIAGGCFGAGGGIKNALLRKLFPFFDFQSRCGQFEIAFALLPVAIKCAKELYHVFFGVSKEFACAFTCSNSCEPVFKLFILLAFSLISFLLILISKPTEREDEQLVIHLTVT